MGVRMHKGRIRRVLRRTVAMEIGLTLALLVGLTGVAQADTATTSGTSETWSQFQASCSADVLTCGTSEAQTGTVIPPVPYGPDTTYQQYASDFPQSWGQLQYNQAHDPVFSVPNNAPSFLTQGGAWASPLTGDEFLRLARGFARYGTNGGENWGSEAAQWLGNVTGVSVVDGIVYAEESRNEIFALDAATGVPIWRAQTVNSAMGDALVESIGGQPVVFVASGDVGFTLQHSLDFANRVTPSQPATRGANFSSVYAMNGLTGKILWRFHTKGEAMPTPVYQNGSVFFDTGDGHLYAVNATTGALESSFANPEAGFSSMSSANYYTTPAGQLEVIYGTQSANFGTSTGDNLLAVNESNPTSPVLAWSYNIPQGINTGLGDVPPVVDQQRGLVLTDALVNLGTSTSPSINIEVLAVDANTGALAWSHDAGSGPAGFVPYSFKGSVPMIHGGSLYVGDLLNQTYQSYDESTGALRWTTTLQDPRDVSGTVHQPRGGAVFWHGDIIEAEGINIFTMDANTGAILNDFMDPGYFGVWGITTPVIVGGEMYLGAISGWIYAVPAQFITTNSGTGPAPGVSQAISGQGNLAAVTTAVVPPNPPSYLNPAALPTSDQASQFPSTSFSYAGGQEHNDVSSGSNGQVSWQTPLTNALPLSAPPRDVGIFGNEVATEMTSLAFGASTGISPVNGIAYVGSGSDTVNAINALTGQLIWTFTTINADYGQPIVTPKTVIVSSGDPWMNFTSLVHIAKGLHAHVGASFQNLHGLDPQTGKEIWTFYTQGSDMATPLYDNGNLYWVDGTGEVWGINADTGKAISPFEDSSGNPTLSLSGFNSLDSANIAHANLVHTSSGDFMVVGTADPTAMYAINLSTDTVAWGLTALPTGLTPYFTGFSAGSPVVYQPNEGANSNGLIIASVLVNADTSTNTVTDEAIAVDATTGAVVWTQAIGSGPIPYGYTAATPFVSGKQVFFADPVTGNEVALDATTGTINWSTPLNEQNKAPGVVVGGMVIQPAGPDIFTLDAKTGALVNTLAVGGDFKDNGPAVVNQTLYVGNSWGWAMAFPLGELGVTSNN